MNWHEHITVDPAICHGRACIRGARITASVVLDNLAENVPVPEILASYPSLQQIDTQAVIAYAAERVQVVQQR